jgi:hypothetical protein
MREGWDMRRVAVCALAVVVASASSGAVKKHEATPTPASTEQTAQKQLSLTVYSNLALVQDTRHLDVAAGRTRLEFKDVSASIRPETVALSGKGLEVVEQNFDYDLLTPAKMMEKAVGHQIQIQRTNPGSGAQSAETATVLSANDGVVLRVGDRIEVLRDDGIPTRVIFSSIPENLRAQPTLSVTVDAASGGARDVMLSYLTKGLSWRADYVALFDEKQGSLRLQGWATLNNTSGTGFADVKTQLVAGDYNMTDNVDDYLRQLEARHSSDHRSGTAPAPRAPKTDYYVYKLPGRVTLAQSQTKQVSLLDLTGIKAQKIYEYRPWGFRSNGYGDNADVVLRFENRDEPLPRGIVRAYVRDDAGEPLFMGEDEIEPAPAGSELGVKIGEAFDVTVQSSVVASEKIDSVRTRYSMSYVLHNARPEPVIVELRQSGFWRDGKIETESLPSRRIDAYTYDWSVKVPANGEATLTFTADAGG